MNPKEDPKEIAREVERILHNRDLADRWLDGTVGGLHISDIDAPTARILLQRIRGGHITPNRMLYEAIERKAKEPVPDRAVKAAELRRSKPRPPTLQFPKLHPFRLDPAPHAVGVPPVQFESRGKEVEEVNRLRVEFRKSRKVGGQYPVAKQIVDACDAWGDYYADLKAYYAEVAAETEAEARKEPVKLKFIRRPATLALRRSLSDAEYKQYSKGDGKFQWPPRGEKQEEAAKGLNREFRKFFELPKVIEGYTFDDCEGGANWYTLEREVLPEPAAQPSGLQIMGGGFDGLQPIEKAMG